jgi:hypothetical protein
VVTRAVSTVLDVTVCLLLLSAAVGTLLLADPLSVDHSADETAEQLAVTTATASDPGGATARRVYGTHAELLARAAVGNLTIAGQPVAPTTDGFRAAVRERVDRVLDRAPARTAVTARYRPYPGAPIEGRVTVGPVPPERATVSTARLSVPLAVGGDRTDPPHSFDALARGLSDAILRHALNPRMRTDGRSARLAERTRAYDRALGDPAADARRRALARVLARDLRDRFATPTAAAAAIRSAVVRVVVREWEA